MSQDEKIQELGGYSEKSAVQEAKKGSVSAFEKILFQHEKRMFSYLYRITKNRHDAEDLTQETFVRVYKNLRTFDASRKFSPWLYKIATNIAYDWLRRSNLRRHLPLEDQELETFETNTPSFPYYLIEEGRDVERALENLKPIHKIVLLLYFWNNLTYQEIAEALKLPLGTVKTHIARAKQEFKSVMEKNE